MNGLLGWSGHKAGSADPARAERKITIGAERFLGGIWLRAILLAMCFATLPAAAGAQVSDSVLDAADDRFHALLEINQPVRIATADAVEIAGAVLRASETEERSARAEEFALAADNARGALNSALTQLSALPAMPETSDDPNLAELVRSHQSSAENGIRSLLGLIARLERVVAAYAVGDENVVAEEGAALVEASILLARQGADEARLRAHLTPDMPWVKPMDNAAAEVIDGMASMIEIRVAVPQRQEQLRDDVRMRAARLQGYLEDAEHAVESTPSDPEIAAVLRELTPALRERLGWLSQAAVELEAGAQATDPADQRAHLQAVRLLYRQVVESQQRTIRDSASRNIERFPD